MKVRRVYLLVGSPRARSTSGALGDYLLDRLQDMGWQVAREQINPALRSPSRWAALLEQIGQADLVVLAFPLYVDQLPAPVIQALEQLAAWRQGQKSPPDTAFMAIANSGFPEALHSRVALQITEQFCAESGYRWVGGLALGGGGIINGMSLEEAGDRAVVLRRALDLCAAALENGEPLPGEAVDLFARPIIPHRLYRLMGDVGWLQSAYQNGVLVELKSRPYLPPQP